MHRYKPIIICPYCNYEFKNSWETTGTSTITCMECERDFEVYVDVTVEYSTYEIEGE